MVPIVITVVLLFSIFNSVIIVLTFDVISTNTVVFFTLLENFDYLIFHSFMHLSLSLEKCTT